MNRQQHEVIYTATLGFLLGTAFWWLCLFLCLEFGSWHP